jgi:hypothetical protein
MSVVCATLRSSEECAPAQRRVSHKILPGNAQNLSAIADELVADATVGLTSIWNIASGKASDIPPIVVSGFRFSVGALDLALGFASFNDL